MMYAHCGPDSLLIEFSDILPQGQRLIAQGEEAILRQAVAETVALLSQEKAWNEKYPVGTAVIVETITRKETRSGRKTTTKINRRRTVGKALVWSGEVMVPVLKAGKRFLVPMSSVSISGRVKP